MNRRRIPVILQMNSVECGAACLAMVLNYFGRKTRLGECRAKCNPGRNGVSVLTILEAAKEFGLHTKAFSLRTSDLGKAPLPCIAHWNNNHFVLLEDWSPTQVEIVDPALGRCRMATPEFNAALSGVVIVFEPGSQFKARSSQAPSLLRSCLQAVLRTSGTRGILVQILGASLLLQAVGFALPLLTKELIDHLIPSGSINGLNLLLVGALLIAFVNAVMAYCRATLLVRFEAHLDSSLMLSFFKHLLSLPYGFFQQRSSGDLLMRLGSNANIREALASYTTTALLDGGLVVIFLIVLLRICFVFGIAALVIAALKIAFLCATARQLHHLAESDLACQAESQSCLVECLLGISNLKAAGNEYSTLDRWGGLLARQLDASGRRGRCSAKVDSALTLIRAFSPLFLLWLGGRLVMSGGMTLGTMFAINALAAAFLQPVGSLVSSAQRLQMAGAHLERIADVMQAQPEQDVQEAKPVPELSGRIELRHVSFRYDSNSPEVVKDVSLSIEPGQKVALVGRTGSGKSTLAKLLLGLYRQSEGEILYDGLPLHALNLQHVRKQWGVALQETFLFNSSLRDNISFHDRQMSMDEVTSAAAVAEVHAEIMQMPMGYETRIDEGGGSLSGGQRQRLAIARAIAKRPRLLLLDEATSHLDVITEKLVDRNLDTLSCTRVVIAHRLSTIENADLIVVLENGSIVEQGSRQELLALGGHYSDLTFTQSAWDHENAVLFAPPDEIPNGPRTRHGGSRNNHSTVSKES
jgi:ABC-type bacteriocin/lantibiotic exporter with double-glycine peptidase domain